jgi:serine/threonine protein kinase
MMDYVLTSCRLPPCCVVAAPGCYHFRLDMLRDIASGMVFLHSRRPPIVHGDLRSPNLLLDLTIDRDKPRFHVKIADFGLARMLGPTSSITVSKVRPARCMLVRPTARSLSAVLCHDQCLITRTFVGAAQIIRCVMNRRWLRSLITLGTVPVS